MKTIKRTLGLALVLCLSLSACNSVKQELGVGRNSPDEFTVVKRAPLTLPPDYSLRPPGTAEETPPATESADTAKEIVLGKSTAPAEKNSADDTLLGKMGVAAANPDIRKQIDEDNGYIALKNRSVADKLIFWSDDAAAPQNIPESIVDPAAETARLKQNKAEGKAVNEGTVPVIEKKKGTLDKIF